MRQLSFMAVALVVIYLLAAALALGCPMWTEDADFFRCGVATWTTAGWSCTRLSPYPDSDQTLACCSSSGPLSQFRQSKDVAESRNKGRKLFTTGQGWLRN